MIGLEHVQLLESRVAKAIDYVRKVTAENAALVSEKEGLQEKLEANQKRIDELEVLVMRFKEEQGRIEDVIMAALDRLSQFEEAFENSLKEETVNKKPAVKAEAKAPVEKPAEVTEPSPSQEEVFFEIPKEETMNDEEPLNEGSSAAGELDIF